jgi:N-acetylglutamate synthase
VSSRLDELARRGWPALSEVDVGGWVVRVSGGVTQRANSVLPLVAPADPVAALIEVERRYREHGLPAVFQLSPDSRPAGLDALLAGRGYRYGAPTIVATADAGTVLDRLPDNGVRVDVATEPDPAWLGLWWAVDGRGDKHALAVARRILTAGPALYGTVTDAGGAAAVARLALVDDWGGLYCMATRADARRRGYGATMLRGLLAHAGVRRTWLQVRAENTAALALYTAAGYTPATRYHYRTGPIPDR